MKKKLITSILLVILLLCSVSPALAGTGDADDPLVSKSYVDGSYPGAVLDTPLANLRASMTVLRYKLSVASGSVTAAKPTVVSAKPGDTITAYAGSSFTVLSGSLKLISLTGTLIDVSDGSTVPVGQTLRAGHRYVSAELSASSLSATSSVSVGALGNVLKTAATTTAFSDVPSNAWFYEDVYFAVNKGLVNGKTATTYDPDGNLSYAEAVKLASCMHQLYSNGSVSLQNATGESVWYRSYVDYALNNGIISAEYSNYDAKITRSEFVAIFYNSMPASQYTPKNDVADNKIPDVKISAAHGSEIYAFYRAGILTGSDSTGTFYPDSSIKRSEVAAVITRMYETSARKSITL